MTEQEAKCSPAHQSAPIKTESWWLCWQLENWSRWMRSDECPVGLPVEACGGVTGYTILGDSESACERMDCELAEATNAAIEGLEPAELAAIYVAYRVMAVYRLRDFEGTLERAKAKVLKSLKLRGIWVG